jgi:hypothetical protein
MQVWEEVRLHAQAGLNMLRCWGGAGCQHNALYEVLKESLNRALIEP